MIIKKVTIKGLSQASQTVFVGPLTQNPMLYKCNYVRKTAFLTELYIKSMLSSSTNFTLNYLKPG